MTLKASTVGGRCCSGNARANTPFGSAKRPDDGTSGNVGAGRTRRQREHAIEVRRRVQLLHGEDRQVLRHAVAEQRSEDADVVDAAVAAAQDRLLGDLMGRAHTRRPVQLVLDTAVQRNIPDPDDPDLAGVQVEEPCVARVVDRLRVDDVEPQPVVERRLAVHAPGVLRVVEVPPLPLARVGVGADVAAQPRHVADQERRQAEPAGAAQATSDRSRTSARRSGARRSARAGCRRGGRRCRT